MKAIVCVTFSVFASLALMAVMKIRQVEIEGLEKRRKFDQIKVRVTNDMWQDIQRQVKKDGASIQEKTASLKIQNEQFTSVNNLMQAVEKQAEECDKSKNVLLTEVEETKKTLTSMMDEYKKDRSGWEREKAELQQQLAQLSPVCDYLKPGSEAIRHLCGDKVVAEKPEKVEPQAEAPKPEEPKVEAPKPEDPKGEAPKPEEPKVEAPKPEEPKLEALKAEEPKEIL